MFLQNDYKKSIARINSYLLDIKDSLRMQLNVIENDITRNSKIVEESKENLNEIKLSFDTSYMVLSSSQVAKADEYAEIDSLKEIIEIREKEIDELVIQKEELIAKLQEVEEIIGYSNTIKEYFFERGVT